MTKTNEQRALLPCPFCGGRASKSLGMHSDQSPWPYVECEDCAATCESAEDWNKRESSLQSSKGSVGETVVIGDQTAYAAQDRPRDIVVTLEYTGPQHYENGYFGWYAHSEDVPGLFLWGPDLGKLGKDIPTVINKLIELNKMSIAPVEIPKPDVQSGWMPIETAPNASWDILVAWNKGEVEMICAASAHDYKEPKIEGGGYLTHWMPLPEPPEKQK